MFYTLSFYGYHFFIGCILALLGNTLYVSSRLEVIKYHVNVNVELSRQQSRAKELMCYTFTVVRVAQGIMALVTTYLKTRQHKEVRSLTFLQPLELLQIRKQTVQRSPALTTGPQLLIQQISWYKQ